MRNNKPKLKQYYYLCYDEIVFNPSLELHKSLSLPKRKIVTGKHKEAFKLSVVIPCFNEEKALRKCLERVLKISREFLKSLPSAAAVVMTFRNKSVLTPRDRDD